MFWQSHRVLLEDNQSLQGFLSIIFHWLTHQKFCVHATNSILGNIFLALCLELRGRKRKEGKIIIFLSSLFDFYYLFIYFPFFFLSSFYLLGSLAFVIFFTLSLKPNNGKLLWRKITCFFKHFLTCFLGKKNQNSS